jgi:nanoRNase/pAp phosphatase (c-di-AMP/oligoRNAs hydrolase)
MRVDGVEIVLGLGCYNEEGVLSLRTSHQETHAGILMQKVIKGLGTGGGHSMTAGGQVRPLASDAAEQEALEEALARRLAEALERKLATPEMLVPDDPRLR